MSKPGVPCQRCGEDGCPGYVEYAGSVAGDMPWSRVPCEPIRLAPHEAAQLMHEQLKALIARTGNPELAVRQFNEAARRAGVNVKVSIETSKPD